MEEWKNEIQVKLEVALEASIFAATTYKQESATEMPGSDCLQRIRIYDERCSCRSQTTGDYQQPHTSGLIILTPSSTRGGALGCRVFSRGALPARRLCTVLVYVSRTSRSQGLDELLRHTYYYMCKLNTRSSSKTPYQTNSEGIGTVSLPLGFYFALSHVNGIR